MGIIATAHADCAASFAAFKLATTPNRAQRRKYVAAWANWCNEWLAKFDAQDNAAPPTSIPEAEFRLGPGLTEFRKL